jgi:hypothetical protein
MLPDDVLLEIFDFCQKNYYNRPHSRPVWKWHLLVHICQRWRQLIFSSPLRLNLQILCTHRTPVRKKLGIWPAFPIALDFTSWHLTPNDEDIAITTLVHSDRVSCIKIFLTGLQLEKMVMVMLEPFPLLTRLKIYSTDRSAPVLPDGFLGGSAPRLQEVHLDGISFPALPTLLLSTKNLVDLTLSKIPPTGYILPEAMVACLVALPRLKLFTIKFETYTSDRIRPPPATRGVLPSLTSFQFQGICEYLENLVAQIDGPQLFWIFIDYLNHPVDFQVTQLSKFIDRSVDSELIPSKRAHISFNANWVAFTLYRGANCPGWDRPPVETTISPDPVHWRIPEMAEILSQFSTTLHAVVHLEIEINALLKYQPLIERAHDADWLHLFRQFPAMQTLDVSGCLAEYVAIALQEITTEMVAEVFPSLRLIFFEDKPASSVETIVAARRLSDRPVTFVETKAEFEKILQSFMTVSK